MQIRSKKETMPTGGRIGDIGDIVIEWQNSMEFVRITWHVPDQSGTKPSNCVVT